MHTQQVSKDRQQLLIGFWGKKNKKHYYCKVMTAFYLGFFKKSIRLMCWLIWSSASPSWECISYRPINFLSQTSHHFRHPISARYMFERKRAKLCKPDQVSSGSVCHIQKFRFHELLSHASFMLGPASWRLYVALIHFYRKTHLWNCNNRMAPGLCYPHLG